MDTQTFTEKFRQRMADRGDTQVVVAALTGVPQAAISRLLSGRTVGMRHTLALLEYLETVSETEHEKGTTDASR